MNKNAMDLLHGFAEEKNQKSWGSYKANSYDRGALHPTTIMLEIMELIAYIESRRKKK